MRPRNEKIDYWSVVGKFIGQDLTKISLPVCLSEPLSALQRSCETLNCQPRLLDDMLKPGTSMDRLVAVLAHNLQ